MAMPQTVSARLIGPYLMLFFEKSFIWDIKPSILTVLAPGYP
jgi:hypothetical protein